MVILKLIARFPVMAAEALALANANGAPVAVYERGGWYGLVETVPDPSEDTDGWALIGIMDPEVA